MIKRLFLSSNLNPSAHCLCLALCHWSLPPLYSLILLTVFCSCRIWRARLLWTSWDRKWSAQTARLNPHSVLPWHGPLMDRYCHCYFRSFSLRQTTPVVSGVCLTPGDYNYSLKNSDVQWWYTCKYEGRYKHCFLNIKKSCITEYKQFVFTSISIPLQTLFAGYTDNLIRVWQVTIGTR